MTFRSFTQTKAFRPLIGAIIATVCGLLLWQSRLGGRWIWESYDCLFQFGSHPVTNQEVVLIQMDNAAYADLQLNQSRDHLWDRAIHARMLNKLADDDCPLVVFDIVLKNARTPESDQALARAMGRLNNIVLAGEEQEGAAQPEEVSVERIKPSELFLTAAKTNWGLTPLSTADSDLVVRRQAPFPNPGSDPDVPDVAARLYHARLSEEPSEKWIRYYGERGPWATLSYHVALSEPPGYFRGKIVFIGNEPNDPHPKDGEIDKFSTPFTASSGKAVGGVQILATTFLNLVNGDWLRRPDKTTEGMIILIFGIVCGAVPSLFRRVGVFATSILGIVLIFIAVIYLYHHFNYWFPWLIVAGAQIPCAFIWAWTSADRSPVLEKKAVPKDKTIRLQFPEEIAPEIPNYELIDPPLGKGGFGKVWLARNAIGQWQAVKVVYQSNFGDNTKPYEAEFNGIKRYKPVSEQHSGLLRVELVSLKKTEGYFYYIMELGDSQTPGWEQQPSLYKPLDLENLRRSSPNGRLKPAECLRICISLAETLDYLHNQSLIHRDIKPSNVIFVKGRPKLADVGLIAQARTASQVHTFVGTPGFMPPPPEPPGTVVSDIYALGMLLYVISTGSDPKSFPQLSATLLEKSSHADFMRINEVILKACHPDPLQRFQSVGDMLQALREADKALKAV